MILESIVQVRGGLRSFMAVRIARGLFRLWIIVSVLWVGGVAAATWWTFPPAELTDEEVGLNTRPTECNNKSNDECEAILTRLGKNPFDAFLPVPPPPAVTRRSAISFAAATALVPPLLLLPLGAALGWAFSGFRSG